MKFLLDTQAMLWLFSEPKRIKRRHKAQLADPANEVFVSPVSTWEISIKLALGKLSLPDDQDPSVYLPTSARRGSLKMMSITPEHTYGVASLARYHAARHHADPFDRLLISQAKFEGFIIVTSDRVISLYDIPTLLI